MQYDEPDYGDLQAEIEREVVHQRRLAGRIFFGTNLLLLILFMIISMSMVFGSGIQPTDTHLAALIMLGVGWAVATFMQGMALMIDSNSGEKQIRDRVMRDKMNTLMQQEMLRRAVAERSAKPKREERLALSEDGELVPLDEWEAEQQRRGRTD